MPSEISQSTQKLIQRYQSWHQSLRKKEGVSLIHVDEVASKVAAFYEKIRGIVDWKEEHLMKRGAIERNLKRRLLTSKEGKTIAESLVLELIRGGHFPNDRIEEFKIEKVEKILNKYIYILNKSPNSNSEKIKFQLYNWILGIAACEIEETLSSSIRENALIDYMMESMKERIKVNEGIIVMGGMSEEEKNTQIYIAVCRALFKLDAPIISYHLLERSYPRWQDLPESQLDEISTKIYLIWEKLEQDLKCPLGDKFYNICERYDTPYLLLGDILTEENPDEFYQKLSKPEILEELIRKSYKKRLSTLKSRINRAAIFSTLSIFLTNSVVLFLVEVPLAKMITGTFSPLAIAVDILGPTFLMFLLVTTISLPSKNNLDVVLMETMKIVFGKKGENGVYEIKPSRKKGFVTKFIISLIYLFGACVSVGIIAYVFQRVNLPPTSIIINVSFVALIAFAGMAIRSRAEELTVEEKKSGLFGFLFDIFFLPIVGLGKWLSNKWKKYNAIAIFFNALIDLPFQIFIEFLEQWRFFLKEKKEEIH